MHAEGQRMGDEPEEEGRGPGSESGGRGQNSGIAKATPRSYTEAKMTSPESGDRSEKSINPALTDTAIEAPSLQLTATEAEFLRRALDILTAREREVVLAICSGGTNEMIAERMCIALPTLRTHLMRLNQKLGTTSKGDVVRSVASTLLLGYREGHLSAKSPS